MNLCACAILIFNFLVACGQVPHKVNILVGCFENATNILVEFDGEEVAYVDFIQAEVVYTAPKWFLSNPSEVLQDVIPYKEAKSSKLTCWSTLVFMENEEKYPMEVEDPPESIIYLAEELQLGRENTLICFVEQFFPPNIQVHWTKNGGVVSEGVLFGQYHQNDDRTFHQVSSLKFTPQEGDIYGCTVYHSALDEPKTKFLEIDFRHPGVLPDVLCGVGLTVALFGVAAGAFLGITGRYPAPVV
ncbi:H-2 class II histocompatibility antigen, A-Q alpha chain-like [Dunckerocampus dactyliophorus]|uniref:H-2 class II histocompatibility antigen, A-Q alpha chain-like n=1 Tax=Dunckerocampus dactyliophorus TaxID=161453 RepID=UPI0024062865|nr:H-2 class II histocompatibility antigen, A-Q alpha chain-like [Dunckerocampus dactyliophorus]